MLIYTRFTIMQTCFPFQVHSLNLHIYIPTTKATNKTKEWNNDEARYFQQRILPIIAIKSTKIIIIEIQNSRNLLRNIQISIKDLSWNKNKRIYNHIIIYSFSHDYHSSWWSWQTTKINIIYFDKIKSLSNYSNYTETNNTTEIIKHREDTKHNLNKDTAKRMKQASSILLINEWRYKIIWLFLFLGIHHYFLLFAI